MFDLQRFSEIAPGLGDKLHCHGQLGSTNDEAHRIAAAGAAHGEVVLAEKQTRGRGRRGAAWLSEPGDGLTFSVVLRPRFGTGHYGKIALAAGLGIASALRESFAVPAELKWPNDVLVGDRKCCGILVESKGSHGVLGIGINVNGSPEGCISIGEAANGEVCREKALAVLLAAVMREVDACAEDFASQLTRIDAISWLRGKHIGFQSGGNAFRGEAAGISPGGNLLVRIGDKVQEFAQAFGIRVVDDC